MSRAANKPVQSLPTPRLHKATGQAYLLLDGRRVYLGRHDHPDLPERYERALAEWRAGGRRPPVEQAELTVVELVARFWSERQAQYAAASLTNTKAALRTLRQLYGRTPAPDFGPKKLKAVRQRMIDDGLARSTINDRISIVRACFAWGVEEELVPPSVHHALSAVRGLRYGRSAARETDPVTPVADEVVEATLRRLEPTVADMVRVQRLTGMRPAEVCGLTTGELDTMLDSETIVTFAEAAKRLPKFRGRRPHASTIWRWARKGINGVKLETRRVGGRFVTSVEALERFTKALSEVEVEPRPERPRRVPEPPRRGRQRSVEDAEAECEREGL